MKLDAYIVNWKETTIDESGVLSTKTGTCDVAYKDIEKAKGQVNELAEEKKDECIDEMGYPSEDVTKTMSDDGEMATVTAGSNTYEFSIYGIDIV